MKNPITSRLCNLLIAGFFIFMVSCENNEIEVADVSIDQRIMEAQIFFETEVENSFSQKSGNHDNNKRKSLKKFLLWDEAYTKQLSFGVGVVVPLFYEKELYVSKGEARIPLSQLSYALIYEDEKGKKQAELVTTLPDETYSNSTDEDQAFSGGVVVEDWKGNFIKGFVYEDGKVKVFTPETSNLKVVSSVCWTTDYYNCSSSDGGETWICFFDYSETICPDSGGGEYPADDYPPVDVGGSGDPGDPDDDPPLDELVDEPCTGDPVLNPEIAPTQNGSIYGGTYGCTRDTPEPDCSEGNYNTFHNGLDIKAAIGSNLAAMYSGTIYDTGCSLTLGNYVRVMSNIDGQSVLIQYCHLSEILITSGEVTAGNIIAKAGNTGNAIQEGTIPHVHIRVHVNWSETDPRLYLATQFDDNGSVTLSCNK